MSFSWNENWKINSIVFNFLFNKLFFTSTIFIRIFFIFFFLSGRSDFKIFRQKYIHILFMIHGVFTELTILLWFLIESKHTQGKTCNNIMIFIYFSRCFFIFIILESSSLSELTSYCYIKLNTLQMWCYTEFLCCYLMNSPTLFIVTQYILYILKQM